MGLRFFAALLLLLSAQPADSAPKDPCTVHHGHVVGNGRFCTHGDDAELKLCVMNSGPLCPKPTPPPPPQPMPGCGSDINRIQALYLRERSTPDRYSSSLSLISQAASDADSYLNASAQREGHTAHFRYVTSSDCTLLVANVVTDRTLDSFSAEIQAVRDAGYTRSDYVFLIFTDNNLGCGIATITYDSQPDPAKNKNNTAEHYANVAHNVCLNGGTVAHELGHTLGAVQPDAPHATGGYHCNDGYEIMCYDDGTSNSTQHNVCPQSAYQLYDCNRDDYFAFQPQSTYLSTHWNTVHSRWLDVK